MKKLIMVLAIVLMLTGCKRDDKDYVCNFKYYNGEGQDGVIEVDRYEMNEDSTIIEVYKMDGSLWVIDSTQIEMYCVEMEDKE